MLSLFVGIIVNTTATATAVCFIVFAKAITIFVKAIVLNEELPLAISKFIITTPMVVVIAKIDFKLNLILAC